MSEPMTRSRVVEQGRPPDCLRTSQQCRGCFGWRAMLKAARGRPAWQGRPFGCRVTGRIVIVEGTDAPRS